PLLKGLWQANAILTPIVSDVAVQMPVSQGSKQMGTGTARVQVNLGNTLSTAALIASTNPAVGDTMSIATQQTVKLLALWDRQGNQITDLGDLTTPTTEPFVLGLQIFDAAPATGSATLRPPLDGLIAKIFTPIVLPNVERYGLTNITGYTSSP